MFAVSCNHTRCFSRTSMIYYRNSMGNKVHLAQQLQLTSVASAGFEPTTYPLWADHSTLELRGLLLYLQNVTTIQVFLSITRNIVTKCRRITSLHHELHIARKSVMQVLWTPKVRTNRFFVVRDQYTRHFKLKRCALLDHRSLKSSTIRSSCCEGINITIRIENDARRKNPLPTLD